MFVTFLGPFYFKILYMIKRHFGSISEAIQYSESPCQLSDWVDSNGSIPDPISISRRLGGSSNKEMGGIPMRSRWRLCKREGIDITSVIAPERNEDGTFCSSNRSAAAERQNDKKGHSITRPIDTVWQQTNGRSSSYERLRNIPTPIYRILQFFFLQLRAPHQQRMRRRFTRSWWAHSNTP